MSLDDKFIPVRTAFYEMVGNFFKKIAGPFGYPTNPGMPTIANISNRGYAKSEFFANLPRHKTVFPPYQKPETWFEVIFGPAPKVDAVPRYIYESKGEGFYNFYIENYRNIYFLPNWLSEFIQVKLHICLDITVLEVIREVIFTSLLIFSQLIMLRITISWWISINPFGMPWCYLTAFVDWTEDVLQGVVPSILGVNIAGSIFLGIIGVIADALNHLVFTMPFLPSEGEASKLLINGELKDVLVFHYLPILWYRYPIPNEIRDFWYNERPDILIYMQKAYKDLDIQFLPDKIIEQLNSLEQPFLSKITQDNHLHDYIQSVSTDTLLNENFHSFVMSHIDKLFLEWF